jgi:phosphatidylinositol glycan class Q protein
MVTKDGLMRIFWPSDAVVGRSSGVLVGFRNSKLDVLVLSILQDVEVRLQPGTYIAYLLTPIAPQRRERPRSRDTVPE